MANDATNGDDVTTVKVKHDTWRSLNELKEPGDTFDDVISNLLDKEDDQGNLRLTATIAD